MPETPLFVPQIDGASNRPRGTTRESTAKTEEFTSESLEGLFDARGTMIRDSNYIPTAVGGPSQMNVSSQPNGGRMAQRAFSSEIPSRPATSQSSETNILDVLSKDVKRMIDTIQRLRVLGFETSVVALPKIVVIGDQSTGKSSVIEGISDIKVPRSVGTCTRCPLEINLKQSNEAWSCKVYLSRRFTYDPAMERLDRNNPYGHWQPLGASEEMEFATVTDAKNVGDAIFWAQIATLNPGSNYHVYRPGHNQGTLQTPEVPFSPNVVRIDMSGPALPNLSFFDLPGLISHIDNEGEKYVVKLIDTLAKDYMKSEETLVLLTLTMNHDPQNSKAAGLIQRMKADERTIGVLTKPDCMSSEYSDEFAEVFEGKKFKRELGYFSVKNNPDPKVKNAQARVEEKAFFQDWISRYPQLAKHKHRFGVELLTEELSKQLVKRILLCLPRIRAIVEEKIEEREQRLEELPKPPSGNFILEVVTNLNNLGQDLKSLFNPDAEEFGFFENWSKINEHYHKMLTKSHPRLEISVKSPHNSLQAGSLSPSAILQSRATAEAITISDDEGSVTPAPPSTPQAASRSRKRRDVEAQLTSRKRQRLGDRERLKISRKVFTLGEIRELINRKNDTGLRGLDNPRVTKDIYSQSHGHWEELVNDYLNKLSFACGRAVMECVRKAFQKQKDTRLSSEVVNKSKNFIKEAFQDHKDLAIRFMNMEKIMYTMSDAASGQVKRDCLKEMREERARQQIEEDETLNDAQRQKKLAAAAAKAGTDEDLFDAELQQMAAVRGYYEYAATRLAENTALSFRSEVFTKIRDDLGKHLISELRLEHEDANAYLGRLLEMDAGTANERARCEQELKRLKEGLQQLDQLEESSTCSSWDTPSADESFVH